MIFKAENNFSLTGRILLLSICLFLISCHAKPPSEKINGISFVASRNEVKPEDLQPVLNVNANAIAVMPFAFMHGLDQPEISFNSERQWWGEREEGVKKTIAMAHEENLSVMLKPQIWIRGAFTGDLKMKSETGWKKLEEQYQNYILFYAKLAESENVDLFCIGTELNSFVQARPEFWNELISKVKEIYNGKLTYAENWDKVEEVHFWKELDYIGADAYFPLSDEAAPTVAQLSRGWRPIKKNLKRLAEKEDKPVLFTEYGYRNIDFTAKEPWNFSRELTSLNFGAQARALSAVYEEVWPEDWFAGGFLWKWHHNHANAGGLEDSEYTPQNKPAEKVVRENYGKNSGL